MSVLSAWLTHITGSTAATTVPAPSSRAGRLSIPTRTLPANLPELYRRKIAEFKSVLGDGDEGLPRWR